MLIKRTNPGNLPGILTEAEIGFDGVPLQASAEEDDTKEKGESSLQKAKKLTLNASSLNLSSNLQ